MRAKFFIYVTLSSLLAGCSSTEEYYPNTLNKNLTLELTTDISGETYSKFEVVAGVNDLNDNCEIDYKGMIKLRPGKNKLGLKPEKLTYLAVEVFQKQSFHSTISSSMRGTLLKPKKSKKYHVVVKYIDNMFDFRLYETRNKKRYKHKIIPIGACQPGK